MPTSIVHAPKYQQVYDSLLEQIRSGRASAGARLPSEADLVRQYGTSRITVARALRELQLAGFVERRAGAGTFVKSRRAARSLTFGVLIPDLGQIEIFDPILRGMMTSPEADRHALLLGGVPESSTGRGATTTALMRQYLDRKVDGVFFAPLEYQADRDAINRDVVDTLDRMGVPVVLLDRSIEPYPHRGRHDLVGLDNRRAGTVVTEHLLHAGSERPAFFGLPHAAASVDARKAGFREALRRHGIATGAEADLRGDPGDRQVVRALLARHRPDGIVCANDRTAARLMRTLLDLGIHIPGEIRLVGIDDVPYASLLAVPLTTLRQPAAAIGAAAVATMRDRVAHPDLPARDVLLHGAMVVRGSCGSV
jgi:GntR family transcriptional regulator, arabinose operon transcriptional repressor